MVRIISANGRELLANDYRLINSFSTGGYAGVFKDVGQEMNYEAIGNTFTVKSGKAIVQGVDFEVELSESVTLQTASGSTVYWYIAYFKIDMSAIENIVDESGKLTQKQGKITLETNMYTNAYPEFPTSDNLDAQPNGTVYLPLYKFKQTNNGVQEVERVFRLRSNLINIIYGDIMSAHNIIALSQNPVGNVKRQVNFVIGKCSFYIDPVYVANTENPIIANVPIKFRPLVETKIYGLYLEIAPLNPYVFIGGKTEDGGYPFIVRPNGDIIGTKYYPNSGNFNLLLELNLNYEITGD